MNDCTRIGIPAINNPICRMLVVTIYVNIRCFFNPSWWLPLGYNVSGWSSHHLTHQTDFMLLYADCTAFGFRKRWRWLLHVEIGVNEPHLCFIATTKLSLYPAQPILPLLKHEIVKYGTSFGAWYVLYLIGRYFRKPTHCDSVDWNLRITFKPFSPNSKS